MSAAKKSKSSENTTAKSETKDKANKKADMAKKPKPADEPTSAVKVEPVKAPGVIASIVELISVATEKIPITKEAICDELAKRFPDRTIESMMRTINVQVPGRISRERGLCVQKGDRGYFVLR